VLMLTLAQIRPRTACRCNGELLGICLVCPNSMMLRGCMFFLANVPDTRAIVELTCVHAPNTFAYKSHSHTAC
jgi:hypothetical protein